MALVLVNDVPAQGLPPIRILRNGVPPDAARARHAMGLFHTIAGARLKVLARKMVAPASTLGSTHTTNDRNQWRFLCHTSPNHDSARVVFHWVPTDILNTTYQPAVYLITNELDISSQPAVSVATSVLHPTVYLTERIAVGTTYVPDHYRTSEQTITLTSNAFHSIHVMVSPSTRLTGIEIHETTRARRYLNTATAGVLAVDMSAMVIGGPIYDRDIADWNADAYTLWKRGGSQLVGHAAETDLSNAATITNATTTEKNVLDNTTTLGTALSAGFCVWPSKRGALNNGNVDPAVFYAYASETGGAGTVKFRDISNNVLATISSIGITAGWYTTTATLPSNVADQKVDISFYASSTKTISFFAGGVIEYLA